jgi:hypothetical protein
MMNSRLWHLLMIVSLLLIVTAACQPQQAEVVELPTLAVLPSETPSNTPIPATETSTPTPTNTATNTSTPTSTVTVTSSLTPTVTLTHTSTVTPTFTLTPTNTATNTPVATATPNVPQILDFTSSSTSVAPNTNITLRWSTVADSARIDQLNQQGVVVQTFSVPPAGEIVVVVPGNLGRLVVYRLAALRGGQEITRSIPVNITCSIAWFFGNEFAPVGSGCPAAVGAVASGKFQPFERGVMVYVTANGLNRIYGLQNDGSRYTSFANTWDGNPMSYDNAPSGLYRPQQEFRWAFLNTNAPIGTWQNTIGWATSEINTDSRTIQFEDTGAFYIDSPIGVYRFSGGDTGTWVKVK